MGASYGYCLWVLPMGASYGYCLWVLPMGTAYGCCLWVLPIGAAYRYRDREFMPHAFAQKELLDDTRSAIKKIASYLPRDVESAQKNLHRQRRPNPVEE